MYWQQSDKSVEAATAIERVFPDHFDIAHDAFLRIKEMLPFPCGIRQSQAKKPDRISFLLGNYRLAALKTNKDGVLVMLAFANTETLPTGFSRRFSPSVWTTVAVHCVEGGTTLNADHPSIELNDDALARFVTACREFKKIAANSRIWQCDIETSWSISQSS